MKCRDENASQPTLNNGVLAHCEGLLLVTVLELAPEYSRHFPQLIPDASVTHPPILVSLSIPVGLFRLRVDPQSSPTLFHSKPNMENQYFDAQHFARIMKNTGS